jgi:hypothetical protein
MPPHGHGPGGPNHHIQPSLPLPPGVYSSPTREELPARATVSQEYFDAIAERLPEGSVRGVVQEHVVQGATGGDG